MSKRPAIPKEIERMILLEAGHRCAIHTCNFPNVEIHHIIPWSQQKEHRYENLIALCPNCHSRADAGEIDRKSLRRYKARLSASFGELLPKGSDKLGDAVWISDFISASNKKGTQYEAQIEFPMFSVLNDSFKSINEIERGKALEWLADFETFRLNSIENDPILSKHQEELDISFDISICAPELVSIRYTTLNQGYGHSNRVTEVRNYQTMPLVPLYSLFSLFRADTDVLSIVSKFCIQALTVEKELTEPSDWILEGAGEKLENFKKFNITENGLLVAFDKYQVDCGAAGPSQVQIPKELLVSYLAKESSVLKVWIRDYEDDAEKN